MSKFRERLEKGIAEGYIGYEEFDDINEYAAEIRKLQMLHVWFILPLAVAGKEAIAYDKHTYEKAAKFLKERLEKKLDEAFMYGEKEGSDESDN